MKFELIALHNNIYFGNYDKYDDMQYFDWQDQIEELFKQSDLIRVTFENGEKVLTAKANFNLGTCNCCNKRGEAKMWEFFRQVES
jgi:hypothetical protein